MSATPPWKRKAPRKTGQKLTPEERLVAEERARKAGRRYPNLVDNLWVLRQRAATRLAPPPKPREPEPEE